MAQISIDGKDLVVEIEGLDKLWAFKSRLVIPLANVRGAVADPAVLKQPKGFRAPGTQMPGGFTAGTFYHDGERIFWDVHDGEKAIVIDLADQRYARLIVEVSDPQASVELIERAIAR